MKPIAILAPLAGWLTKLEDVPDPVFAEGMMGSGIAIDPVDGLLTAPCDAEVVLVAAASHSVTLRAVDGAELLIHIGLETVALAGRGFDVRVKEGQQVRAGDALIEFEMDSVGLQAKSLVTPIVLTNEGGFRFITEATGRLVQRGEPIGHIEPAQEMVSTSRHSGDLFETHGVVQLEHGLHARPAGRISDSAKHFRADVTLSAGDRTASARSPVAIMALDVRHGDPINISARGEQAQEAVQAILRVIEDRDTAQRSAGAAPVVAAALASNEIAGVSALAGAAVGTAKWWRRSTLDVPEQGKGEAEERAAFEAAKAQVHKQLQDLAAGTDGAGSEIARAHMSLLQDEAVNAEAYAQISAGKSAAYAWRAAMASAVETLRGSGNAMLRERVADLEDLSDRTVRALLGDKAEPDRKLPDGAVLLAEDLLPSELLSVDRTKLAGICIGGAGPTSHVAIIAASLGVPTLVGMGARLGKVADGARVLIDASAGKLVIGPCAEQEAEALSLAAALTGHTGACATSDGHAVALLANLGSLADVETAVAAGAEGCGLLRTEFLFLDRNQAPTAEEQAEAYQAISDALGDRPLTIRTLDIGGDKPVPFLDLPAEENPALGVRGIRTSLARPDLLDAQLRAVLAVRRTAPLKLMIPMVSSIAEFRLVRERVSAIDAAASIKLGVMIETPAAALLADQFAAEADFLSIGSNDLAQYALAMDRTNPALAASVDGLHPAVLRLIETAAQAADRQGKPISVCGGLASEPAGAIILIGLEIHELSAVPATLAGVRAAIAGVSLDDCRSLAERALRAESAAEVRMIAAELVTAASKGDR
ncbi:MAG: phosphoenolpyruvate--protein phosphotransferase [Sphingomicrobium sp.]